MKASNEFAIPQRFCGPPDSGNGGYVCGRLAAHIEGDAAVRLHRPPPLERPLQIRATDSGVELLDGEQRVASAQPTQLALAVPDAPSFEQAREAATGFRGFHEHVFPGCFVCGPERGAGDGLRIFPGPLTDRDVVAAPWVPDASLGARHVANEYLWAALDCPGVFSFPQPEHSVLLLGELSAQVEFAPEIGEECVLIGWRVDHSGRKHRTGTALFGSDGRRAAIALGVWIEVPR